MLQFVCLVIVREQKRIQEIIVPVFKLISASSKIFIRFIDLIKWKQVSVTANACFDQILINGSLLSIHYISFNMKMDHTHTHTKNVYKLRWLRVLSFSQNIPIFSSVLLCDSFFSISTHFFALIKPNNRKSFSWLLTVFLSCSIDNEHKMYEITSFLFPFRALSLSLGDNQRSLGCKRFIWTKERQMRVHFFRLLAIITSYSFKWSLES